MTYTAQAPPTRRISSPRAEISSPFVHVEHSIRFDLLRVVACLAVILLHLAATIVKDHEFIGTIHWHVSNAINAATTWCVPVFVMLSGALLLNPKKHQRLESFWGKRAIRLLPALIAWSAIYFAWRAFYWHESLSLSLIAHDVAVGQPYIHFYFLFLIAGLYLVTPFLTKTFTMFSHAQIRNLTLVMAGLALGDSLPGIESGSFGNVFTMFVPYLPYYVAGWYCTKLSLERTISFRGRYGRRRRHDHLYRTVGIVKRNRRSLDILFLWQFQSNRYGDDRWRIHVYHANNYANLARIFRPATRTIDTWRLCPSPHRRRTPALRVFHLDPESPSSPVLCAYDFLSHLRNCVSSYRTYAAGARLETDRVDPQAASTARRTAPSWLFSRGTNDLFSGSTKKSARSSFFSAAARYSLCGCPLYSVCVGLDRRGHYVVLCRPS